MSANRLIPQEQPGTSAAPIQTTVAVMTPRIPPHQPWRLDLALYIVNANFALLIPAIQENTVANRRGLRKIIIMGILIICGIVSFGLKQTYVVLPVIIDIGLVLACQDLPDDNNNLHLLPRQTQDLNRGLGSV
ncbi:hypothetical protein IFR05_012533 [Cadophora sp. M221]|nr:hypothetical protein IFR05_012533 [Cadophora sp. M221]